MPQVVEQMALVFYIGYHMGLNEYNQKRNFKKTAEPEGKEMRSKGKLRFVVQKHAASTLHYDLRLEMGGVLKSWAVPKGPSLNPADKRLAILVEDHPLSYRRFEGIIPEGEYGGGTVIVWDEGTYEPSAVTNAGAKEQEKTLLQQWENGKISVVLHGQKLRGEFALFKTRNGRNAWMLVKKKDSWSSENDITEKAESVKSGKTMEEVSGIQERQPPKPKKRATAASKKKVAGKQEAQRASTKKGAPATMPQKVLPMLATLVDEPFDNNDWLFEIKWDGYRALAYCNGKNVELESRNLKPFTQKYSPLANALAALNLQAVFDGEIVAVNETGLANFQALQNWQNTPVQLQYFIFDILWLNGQDVSQLPLWQRKALLQKTLPADNAFVRYSEHLKEKGKAFFNVALEQGLEGIMAKKADSVYLPGTRTPDWVKIKVALRQEVVIAGYTAPRNSRKHFGSLLLGVYENKRLVYVGHTGSGFTKKTLEEIYGKLQPLVTNQSPFDQPPKTNTPATWVKPQLVCEIKFTEWTKDKIARHAIFMGMRVDKSAREVIAEKSKAMSKTKTSLDTSASNVSGKDKKVSKKASGSNAVSAKKSNADEQANNEVLTVSGVDVSLTNLQKIYWPKEGFRKGDMLAYYRQMAPYILPYLLQRPHSLNRHPNGITAPNFFQKDMRGKIPDWVETFSEFSESTGKTVEYLVCSNEATLLYMANLGCIEINPWHARTKDYLKPDWCLIDLDPDKSNSFDEVVDVAVAVKRVLDAAGATSCVKTSGSTGIHIYIPLAAKYGFEESKKLAEAVVTVVNRELPELTSMERTPAKRKGKIYLDFLQNKETQTAAAPYSLRPKPGVPVSTPLDWSEVKHGLTPQTWNAYNIFDRVKTEGDLFAPVLAKGIALKTILKKVQDLID